METKALFTVLVAFTNGDKTYNAGEQDEVREDYAKSWEQAGYVKVEGQVKESSIVEVEPTNDGWAQFEYSENLSYSELKALAKEKGIKGYTTMSRDKLIEVLKEA
jgi:hypothetical protein